VDGFFWVSANGASSDAGSRGRVYLLIVAGMRSGRPGFSVVTIPPVNEDTMATWGEATVRESGQDFESELPGSALEGLHQLTSPGEALKLAARLWALRVHEPVPGAVPAGTVARASLLPYRRISVA
jgi:hypothetical protein